MQNRTAMTSMSHS
jgi:hypothetical protein